MHLRHIMTVAVVCCMFVGNAIAETITVATYNVQLFESRFEAYRLSKTPEAKGSELVKQLLETERFQNEEDQWEVAQVIADPAFNPDVLVIEEGCSESNLRHFNKRWLNNSYETVIVFPSNSGRDQNLCMMLKPGFKIIAKKDKYYEEKDPGTNERGLGLFARGPAFCLIQTPSGYRFWVGVTHQKSKRDNDVEMTAWRNRESKRTHEIMLELQKAGPEDVILLGDMNDDFGVDEFEKDPKSGGDTVATLVGPPKDGFILLTEKLAKAGELSYHGYWNTKYRGFIDHAIATPSMKDQIEDVQIFRGSLAAAASDHYPVMVKIKADAPSGKTKR